MKKAIKKYLTQLHENEEKGFSLVELIIVMAIMAILVGVVASQVIPYMEKSRQSKDQQVISALLTDINSAIAQSAEACKGGCKELKDLKDVTNDKTIDEFIELRPQYQGKSMSDVATDLMTQVKSKAFNASGMKIYVSVDATTGETVVFFSTNGSTMSNSKSVASTKEGATVSSGASS
ncbi:MAG: type II secretion system GspH family protein [Lachnospiraceae bacterium]|nr:type II secretion system GspH family protein [Lachnospiraceae bacterium]